jgi:hypothetical protein
MGTPKFVNPKPQVEIWHILNYQTQVVDKFLETKQIWKLIDFKVKDSNGK